MAVQFSLQKFELQSPPDGSIFVNEQFEIRGILIDNDVTNGLQTASGGYFDLTFDPNVLRIDEITYGTHYDTDPTSFNLADVNAGGASAGFLDEIGAYNSGSEAVIEGDSSSTVYILFTLKVTALVSTNNTPTNFGVEVGSRGVFLANGNNSDSTNTSPESFIVESSTPTVSIAVLDGVAAEPNNHGSFTITRSGGSGDISEPLTVSYTVSGTATNGADYSSLPLSITIPANATSVTLPITMIDDSSVEGTESVQITLVTSTSNPTSYVVDSNPNQASASLNISDNDGISYTVGVQSGADILTDRSITEGNTGTTPVNFVVTRGGDTSIASSVSYAFSGTAANVSDYTIDNGLAANGTINFATNETTKTVSIQVLADVAVEPDETILLTLSNPQPSNANPIITNATATLNLTNDDQAPANPQVNFAVTSVNTTEDATAKTINVTVTISSSPTDTITVPITVAANSNVSAEDYTLTTTTVTFAANTSILSQDIPITIQPDNLPEGAESLILNLGTPTGTAELGSATQAVVTIAANDAIIYGVTTDQASVTEGNSDSKLVTFTINRNGGTGVASTVDYSFGGTATNGTDYTINSANAAGTLSFGVDELTKTITVNVLGDTTFENNETIVLNLSNPSASNPLSELTTDTITTTVTNDDSPTVIEVFFGTASINQIEDNLPVTISIPVTLNGTPPNAVTVPIIITGSTTAQAADYVLGTSSITFVANTTTLTQNVSLTIQPDDLPEDTENIVLGFGTITGGAASSTNPIISTVSIPINDPISYSINTSASTIQEGNSGSAAVTFTVSRSGGIGVGSSINYSLSGSATNGSDYTIGNGLGATGTVTFAANETSKTITVNVAGDTTFEPDETVTVTLSSPSATTPSSGITISNVTTTITNDDPIPLVTANFGQTNLNATEDLTPNTILIPVTISGSPLTDVTIPINISGLSTAQNPDYTLGTTSLTFLAGTTTLTQNVSLTITPDTLPEDIETVVLNFGTISGSGQAGVNNSSTISIPANDAINYTLTGNSPTTITEGNSDTTALIFTVGRNGGIGVGSSIDYVVTGTATNGIDYNIVGNSGSTGTLSFAADETSKTITINVNGDVNYENNESIIVSLANPSVVVPPSNLNGVSPITTTISNDDAAPTVNFGVTSLSQAEPSSPVTITVPVTLSGIPLDNVTVPIIAQLSSLADSSDYTINTTTLTFLAGTTSLTQNVSITIQPDDLPEGDETIVLGFGTITGSALQGSANSSTITIPLNDVISYDIAATNSSITEGDSSTTPATFTVTRSGGIGIASTIDYAISGTADSNDYSFGSGTNNSGTLSFGVGETSKTLTVNVSGDTLFESNENIIVTLSAPSATNPTSVISSSTATTTITNDDPLPTVNFGTTSITQIEDTGAVTITIPVTLSNSSINPVTVPIVINGSSTAQGSDYILGTTSVTFAAGTSTLTQNVSITINPDDIPEGDETVILNFGTITGGNAGSANSSTITIPANDAITYGISTSATSVVEGNSSTTPVTFTVTRSGGIGVASTVDYAFSGTAGSGDYTINGGLGTSGTLSFAANESSKTITINVNGDTAIENNEDVILTISNPSSSTPNSIIASASALTAIVNDDSFTYDVTTALGFTEGNSGATSLTFTVTRNGIGLPSSVAYNIGGTATNGSDFNNIRGTSGASGLQGIINFAANETTKTILVDVLGDTIVEPDETISVTLTNPSPTTPNSQITTPTATFVIFEDDQPRVSFGSPSFTQAEGNTTATVLVPITLSAVPLSDVIIPITINANSTASANDYTLGTTSITFAANTTTLSQNVAVNILSDDLPEDAEQIIINFGSITGALTGSVDTAVVTIPANDPLRYTVITSDAAILERNTGTTPVTFTVTRSGGIGVASDITYALTGDADSTDYTIGNGLTSTGIFSFAANETSKTLTVNITGDTLKELNENITLTLSNPSSSIPPSIIDNAQVTTTILSDEMPELASLANQLFRVDGSGIVQLQFNKRDRNVGFVNEVGAFVVDGNDGNIDGVLPGELGYLTKAMNRARSVFSGLRDSVFDTGNQRILSFNGGDLVAFFLVVNGSLDMVRDNLKAGNLPSNLVFAMPGGNSTLGDNYLKITPGANGIFNLGWEDSIASSTGSRNFNDFSLDISVYGDPIPLGVDVNGNSETIDLRDINTPTVNAFFQVRSEAAFNNFVGFYTVDDAITGKIGTLNPDDAGYAAAAINRRVTELNRDIPDTVRSLGTGVLLAPFVIANGDVQDWLVRNAANAHGDDVGSLPVAYFSYGAANPDKFDHIRLLGSNVFGFEDLPNGGDQDFNDIVMRVSFTKPSGT